MYGCVKQRFVVCICWVDAELRDHEDVIGVCNVGNISADTLTSVIRDVLLRLTLNIKQCRGQCYDGTSNLTRNRSGVATQLQKEEPRAVLTHCNGHALNLAVGDTINNPRYAGLLRM